MKICVTEGARKVTAKLEIQSVAYEQLRGNNSVWSVLLSFSIGGLQEKHTHTDCVNLKCQSVISTP